MLIPRIGGRYADIVGFHDPALEPVVEIYSDWDGSSGSSMTR